ncbi:MAG: response regulator [Bacteroidales bacterium]|nr:response regulator [Bacteroidales bacterium]
MHIKNPVIIFILSCLLPLLSYGQAWRAPVEIDISNPTVNAIAQASDGYLWFGTNRGLNRFNGVNYSVLYQGDSTALSNDRIWCLCADTGNRIWVGTSSGINLVKDSKVVRSPSPKFDAISAISDYDEEHLVCGGFEGIFLYDKETQERRIIFPEVKYPDHLLVTFDKKIIASGKAGEPEVFVLDGNMEVQKHFSLPDGRFNRGIVQAQDGTVFFATSKGILAYDNDFNEIPRWDLLLEEACGKKDPDVIFITKDNVENCITLGIAGGEIYQINPANHEIEHAWHNISLSDAKSGVCLITEDNLFLSTDAHPLVQDIRNNEIFVIKFDEIDSNDKIAWVHHVGENLALVVTYNDVFLLNMSTGAYRIVTPSDRVKDKVWISRTTFSRNGNLWVVTSDRKILQYNLVNNELSKESEWQVSDCPAIWGNSDGSISYIDNSYICSIKDGKQSKRPLNRGGTFWRTMPSSSGKHFFMHDDKVFQYTEDGQFYELPIETEAISTLSEDLSGRIWIGKMNGGLQCYDPKSRESILFTEKDGLADNNVRSLAFNDRGTWGSTRNSLFHINNEGEILPIPLNTPNNIDFIISGAILGDSGQVAFAGEREIVEIFPIRHNIPKNIPLNLDAMLINNSEYPDFGKKIVLEHTQDLVVFYFSAKDFILGKQLNFAYMLEGHDNKWVMSGPRLRAFYSNLKSGKYRFHVKVQTPDGNWQLPQELIEMQIKPSVWASVPAKLLYLLLFGALAVILTQLSIRNKRNKERAERSEMEKTMGEHISREKTEFFMNISHEYRTPLSLIYGPAQELSRNNSLNEHDKHLVRLIERNAEKMMSLTEQVVNFDRLSSSEEQLAVRSTNLESMLKDIVKNFEYILEKKKIALDWETSDTRSPEVWCDREKIEKIFFNILSNAVKYTPEEGSISLRIRPLSSDSANAKYDKLKGDGDYSGEYAEVTIKDTGIGIAEEDLERIFQRFERVRNKVGGSVPEGLGIGLNHVMRLIGLHKGAIKVSQNKPSGAVFSFVIPCEKQAYEGAEIWHDVPTESTGRLTQSVPIHSMDKDLTVLLVEDNEEMRVYLNDLLGASYNVMLACDGDEATRFIRISAPDLVISDIMMPYKDGYQLCRELKSSPDYCHIPIILLTAKSGKTDELEGLGAGADAYMQKPFDPQLLFALIDNIMGNRRRIQKILGDNIDGNTEKVITSLEINPNDKEFLEKIYAMMEERISDEGFNVSAIADSVGMSRSCLFSKMKTLTGMSPQEFLINYRLNKAREMILSRRYNVSEVAYNVGFSTLNGFSRAFKNKFGIPPSAI